VSRTCSNYVNHSDVDFQSCHRAYFSRLTRELRTKGNTKQTAICTFENNSELNDEEQQLQEEEHDGNDFDAAISVVNVHDLLDGATHVIDSMLQQQKQPSTINQSNSSSPTTSGRIAKTGRTYSRRE
jgi:hypothetical protein